MLYLSLTLGCFEMQPLSPAGKNKIPSFDKVNCGPQQAISWQYCALIFKCCELKGLRGLTSWVPPIRVLWLRRIQSRNFPMSCWKKRCSEDSFNRVHKCWIEAVSEHSAKGCTRAQPRFSPPTQGTEDESHMVSSVELVEINSALYWF